MAAAPLDCISGANRDRTGDLLNAISIQLHKILDFSIVPHVFTLPCTTVHATYPQPKISTTKNGEVELKPGELSMVVPEKADFGQ